MTQYKKTLLFIIIFNLISCGRNKESEQHELELKKEPSYEQKDTVTLEQPQQKKDTVFYGTPEDSIKAVKRSILRKQKFKKKKETEVSENTPTEIPETPKPSNEPTPKKIKAPSFVYIKKILNECEIGVTMTQEDLQANFNIPKEAIQLVKSVTKISDNELDIKWKSTWLIEKISDAKFHDGRLKVRFENNRMYTTGGAISIKYEKKLYTDLYLIGRSAYIPTVKGFYWQIGEE